VSQLASAKSALEEMLWRQGLWVRNYPRSPLHQRVAWFDLPAPLTELRLEGRSPRWFELSPEKITTPYGFSFAERGWHPYVASLREPDQGYDKSVLARFHQLFTPTNLAEAITPDPASRPVGLERIPHSWALVRDLWILDTRTANTIRDRSAAMAPETTSPHVGPVQSDEGYRTYSRLLSVCESMSTRGYAPHQFDNHPVADFDGFPADGYFLWRDNDYRFVLLHGHHRVAAATYLGVDRVLVSVRRRYAPVIDGSTLISSRYSWLPSESQHIIFDSLFGEDGARKARHWDLT
jgi:hypothetical protein